MTIRTSDLSHVHVLHSLTNGESWFGHFFLAEIWDGEARVGEPQKHADLTWASADNLPQPMVPYVESALIAIQAGTAYSAYGWREGDRRTS